MAKRQGLERWLEEGQQLFSGLFPGQELGVIVVPVAQLEQCRRDGVPAVVMRLDRTTGPTEHQVVTLTEKAEPAKLLTAADMMGQDREEPLPRVHIQPRRGLELIEPVDISTREGRILEIISQEKGRLLSREVAVKMHTKPDDSRIRQTLASMIKRRLLDNEHNEGYGITLRGHLSLERWRGNQIGFAGEEE